MSYPDKSPKKELEKFIKQSGSVFLENGKICFPVEKFFEQDLNYQFTFDPEKFLGEFRCEYYHLSRKYLQSVSTRRNLRLYYTNAKPFKPIKASFLLIHGFGEHSSRYMEVYINIFFLISLLFYFVILL